MIAFLLRQEGSWWTNGLVLHGGNYILTTTLLRNFLRKLDVWWQRMEMMMRKSDHRGLNLTRSRDNHVPYTEHLHWCVHLIWSNVDWHLFTSSNLCFYSTYIVYTVNSQTCFVLYSMELIGKQGRHTVFFLLKFAWWSYNCKYGQAHDTGLVSTTRLQSRQTANYISC